MPTLPTLFCLFQPTAAQSKRVRAAELGSVDGDDEEEAPEDKSPFGGLLKALGTVTMKASEPGQSGTIVPSKAISGKKTGTTVIPAEAPAKGGFFGFGTKAVQVSSVSLFRVRSAL